MSWMRKGISMCKRAMSGPLFQPSKLKQARQQSSECCPSEFKSLFDEAPVPEGSWAEHYKRGDQTDTKVLAAGVVFFVITMGVVRVKGLVKGHPEIALFG